MGKGEGGSELGLTRYFGKGGQVEFQVNVLIQNKNIIFQYNYFFKLFWEVSLLFLKNYGKGVRPLLSHSKGVRGRLTGGLKEGRTTIATHTYSSTPKTMLHH